MPQAVAVAILGAAAEGTAAFVAIELLATIAINLLLSRVSRLLIGKPRRFTPDTTQEVTVIDSVAARMIIYGQPRVGGVIIHYGTSTTNSARLYYVIAAAGHQCDSMTDVWFDNVKIQNSDIDGSGSVTGGVFATRATIYRQLGTSAQTALSDLTSDLTEWTSAHKGVGIAYFAIKLTFDAAVYPNGAPRDFFVLTKGRRVYDPRLDTTNGGAGSHRLTDPSTWAWSDNPALCVADYITGGSQWFDTGTITARLGMNESSARIDWPYVVTAANECDETPAVPGGTQKRYTCNGVLTTAETHQENLSKLISSMAGQIVYTGGKYRIFAGAYDSPAHTITDADLTGPYQVNPSTPRDELFNAVSAVYVDPLQNYQPVTAPLRTDSTSETNDGERIIRPIDLPFTNNSYTAQRIAELHRAQSRNQMTGFITLGLNGFKVAPWETFNLSLSEFWAGNRIVRATDCKLIPESPPKVRITFREESSTAYSDMSSGSYGAASTTTPGANTTSETPAAPTDLRAVTADNGVFLTWTLSSTPGATYEVDESTAVAMTSPTLGVYKGADAQAFIDKATTGTFYYRVSAIRNGIRSAYNPTANGVAGVVGAISAGFRATVSPGIAYKQTPLSSGTTNNVTATPVNGTAPYTYAWARVSGDSSFTASAATSATTHWDRTTMTLHVQYDAIWRCTITDNVAATATVDLPVSILRENDA